MVTAAARLRIDHRWDVGSRATADVLRSLARRARELRAEARRLERTIEETVRAWRPDVLDEFGVGYVARQLFRLLEGGARSTP